MSFGFYRLGSASLERRTAYVASLASLGLALGKPEQVAIHGSSNHQAPKPMPPSIDATLLVDPRTFGYTGNSCQDCGSTKMKIAGHCEICEDCGASTGCS